MKIMQKDCNIPAFRRDAPLIMVQPSGIHLSPIQVRALFQLLIDQSLRGDEWQDWEDLSTGGKTSIAELMTTLTPHLRG
jgi:hypothetical protein